MVGSTNNAPINDFLSGEATIEDNYFLHNQQAVYIKAGASDQFPAGTQTITFRRNWVDETIAGNPSFRGPAEAGLIAASKMLIYDNVIDQGFMMQFCQDGSQIYNNLFLRPSQAAGGPAYANAWIVYDDYIIGLTVPWTTNLQVWNNVVNPVGPPPTIEQMQHPFEPIANGAIVSYFDHNIYVGTPSYWGDILTWPGSPTTLEQFQALGGDANCHVVTVLTDVYPGADSGDFTLAPEFMTAGRDGDGVGPRVPISGPGGIMDVTRYGPTAMGSGPPPEPPTPIPPTPTPTPPVTGAKKFRITLEGEITLTPIPE
jgi:hypothetical protein